MEYSPESVSTTWWRFVSSIVGQAQTHVNSLTKHRAWGPSSTPPGISYRMLLVPAPVMA